jgi:pimeloyl-ACP methyl ester carboxylesterase
MRFLALILCALAASTLNWSAPAHCAAPASSEQRLAHISIETVGRGDPVVLIPGLSTPRDVWDDVVPQLAKSHRVLLVQVNGFAGDQPGANLQGGILDGAVADLHTYLSGHKLGHAAIVGHSMGGLVALQLAKAHPEDASKLMIVDSLPYVGEIFVPGATVAQLQPQAKAMRDQIVGSYGTPNPGAAKATAATMALTTDAQAKVAAWITKADARVSGEAMYEDLTTDLRPDMAAIATPITLVYPWSKGMPQERADAFYKAQYAKAPNVRFVGIGDAAHFVMLDQQETFAAALTDFLK